MEARYYAPSLGAFTQMDTVAGSAANPASMNGFLYAEANPATLKPALRPRWLHLRRDGHPGQDRPQARRHHVRTNAAQRPVADDPVLVDPEVDRQRPHAPG